MRQKAAQAGFTIVELSIALVVIAVIVAGVLGGTQLLTQSRLQQVMWSMGTYDQAVQDFVRKFGGLPGDLSNASYYFGASCAGNDAAKCNGNGNGTIDFIGSDNEALAAWHHLSLAGLIPLSVTYTATPSIGVSMPASKIDGGGFWLWYQGQIVLGSDRGAPDHYLSGGVLTPAESYKIDRTLDDGKPGTGKWQARRDQSTPNDGTICIDEAYDSPSIASANYLLSSDSTRSCFGIYVTAVGSQATGYPAH